MNLPSRQNTSWAAERSEPVFIKLLKVTFWSISESKSLLEVKSYLSRFFWIKFKDIICKTSVSKYLKMTPLLYNLCSNQRHLLNEGTFHLVACLQERVREGGRRSVDVNKTLKLYLVFEHFCPRHLRVTSGMLFNREDNISHDPTRLYLCFVLVTPSGRTYLPKGLTKTSVKGEMCKNWSYLKQIAGSISRDWPLTAANCSCS